MADEASQVDPNTDASNDANDSNEAATGSQAAPELTREELLAELARVRTEAGGRRVAGKEKDALLATIRAENEALKREKMTESQKLQADNEALRNENKVLAREKLQRAVAKATKLDPDLADLLTGESEEEMTKVAKKLVARVGEFKAGDAPTANSMLAGKRGKPVESSAEATGDAILRKMLAG